MNTLVTMHVVHTETAAEEAIDRAFGWFYEVEERCSRFNPESELMRLCRAGEQVGVSAILFEAVRFALLIAEESGGAFDPTVGAAMEARGFNRNHWNGEEVRSAVCDEAPTWRDVVLDAECRAIALRRPLTLDLGAVAKGLAVDLAARELSPFRDFAIDAGGDLYLGGSSDKGEPWIAGIRHPRDNDTLIARLRVSNQAVCTSGDYERGPHILDPRAGVVSKPTATGALSKSVACATVIAPNAMLADALATAAFVLGPEAGIEFLERMGVDGLIVAPDLKRCETRGLPHAA